MRMELEKERVDRISAPLFIRNQKHSVRMH